MEKIMQTTVIGTAVLPGAKREKLEVCAAAYAVAGAGIRSEVYARSARTGKQVVTLRYIETDINASVLEAIYDIVIGGDDMIVAGLDELSRLGALDIVVSNDAPFTEAVSTLAQLDARADTPLYLFY